MGALMATKRTRRGAAKSASRVPEREAYQTTPGTPVETSVPDSGNSDAELIDAARKSLMGAVLESATALADGAKEGSVPHIKLLLQLVGLDEAGFAPVVVRPKEKTLGEYVMEQWYREP
jgi:hypothetical protein